MEIKILIIWGSEFDLGKFDFSFLDISLVNVTTERFKNYFKRLEGSRFLEEGYYDTISEILEDNSFNSPLFAIVKNNPNEHYNYEDIWTVYKFLHVLYPSDLHVYHLMNYSIENGIHNSGYSTWGMRIHQRYPPDYLIASEREAKIASHFALENFNKFKTTSYLGFIIENYLTSYDASHNHFRFLSLCMALEGLIHGNNELTYRIKRTVAVLCAENVEQGEIFAGNVKEIYALRSKIIHGEPYNAKAVKVYIQYLQALIARCIVELIANDITDVEKLEELTVVLGYGQKKQISGIILNLDYNIASKQLLRHKLEKHTKIK